MTWLSKGLSCGLLLFTLSQAFHHVSGADLSPLHVAVDLAQWLFAGFGIGIFIRSRMLLHDVRKAREEHEA